MKKLYFVLLISGVFLLSACTPRIEVAAPTDPIIINLNVSIKHEILVKIDKEVEDIIESNEDLF